MITETSSVAPTPAGSAAATSSKKLSADFDQFLTMLVTQLKHQDPLSPLDTNQFTQQLVQFASVEQQIQQNANLETLINIEKQGIAATMSGYLGHSVEIAGNQLPLQDGRAAGSYALGGPAKSVTVQIKNAAGNVVASFPGETGPGRHAVTWDGEGTNGKQLADGIYQLDIKALDKAGKPVPVETSVQGRVTGLGYDNGATRLLIDDAWIGADEIVALHAAPSPDENDD